MLTLPFSRPPRRELWKFHSAVPSMGFTKLITSFSAFLKEPKATQVQTSRGSPFEPGHRKGTSWERLRPHKSKAHQAAASLPWERGVISRAPFSGRRGPDPARRERSSSSTGTAPSEGRGGGKGQGEAQRRRQAGKEGARGQQQ